MKKLILGLLALVMLVSVSWGQGGNKQFLGQQKKTLSVNCTATGIYDTTIVFNPPETSFFGEFTWVVKTDATTDMVDSLRIRVQPGYGNATDKYFLDADGDSIDWAYAKIYEGGTNWATDFDWGVTITDLGYYFVSLEMGGVSWPAIIMNVQHYDQSDSTSVGTVYIDPYEY